MATFADMIIQLQMLGVLDVLLPFILIFTVVFAVLQKSKILGKESKKYNIIVALVLGAAVVFPHIIWGTPNPTVPYLINGMIDPVKIINNSLPSIAVVVIAVIMVMLLLGVFGAEFNLDGKGINTVILLIAFATVVYVFGTNAGFFGNGNFPPWLWFLEDPNTQSLLVMILVFGAIIYFITKDENKENKEPVKEWIKALEGKKD